MATEDYIWGERTLRAAYRMVLLFPLVILWVGFVALGELMSWYLGKVNGEDLGFLDMRVDEKGIGWVAENHE